MQQALSRIGADIPWCRSLLWNKEHYERSQEIERMVGDVRSEERTLNDLGELYGNWGQPSKARQHYEKAWDIKSKLERVKVKDRP